METPRPYSFTSDVYADCSRENQIGEISDYKEASKICGRWTIPSEVSERESPAATAGFYPQQPLVRWLRELPILQLPEKKTKSLD